MVVAVHEIAVGRTGEIMSVADLRSKDVAYSIEKNTFIVLLVVDAFIA